jgi:2-polyprenyl-6-methoxyphenol hydroxylase-like FAD-dependent oxidoreductase
MRKIGDHAVVLGASMAGLLAARVLTDAYERVTIVERDPLPATGENRRGVPQGRHAHVLLAGGAKILDELFPGLLGDLVVGGAVVTRDLAELRSPLAATLSASRAVRRRPPPTKPAGPTWKVTCVPGSGRCPLSRSSTGARS